MSRPGVNQASRPGWDDSLCRITICKILRRAASSRSCSAADLHVRPDGGLLLLEALPEALVAVDGPRVRHGALLDEEALVLRALHVPVQTFRKNTLVPNIL